MVTFPSLHIVGQIGNLLDLKSLVKNTTSNYKLVSVGKYNLLYNDIFYDEVFQEFLVATIVND